MIREYELSMAPEQIISMPKGTEVLGVDLYDGQPRLRCLVCEGGETKAHEKRAFLTVPAWMECDGNQACLGQIRLFNGDLNFHVYEV